MYPYRCGHNAPSHHRGFTLIELLVAIAILGILGSLAMKSLFYNIDDSRQLVSKQKADSIFVQCQTYKRNHGEFPDELAVLTEPDPRNANLPYVDHEDLLDGWGHPLTLIDGVHRGTIEIVSFGANSAADGFDDLALGYDRDLSSGRPFMPEE